MRAAAAYNRIEIRGASPADEAILSMLPIRKYDPTTGVWSFPNATRIRVPLQRLGVELPPMGRIRPYSALDPSFTYGLTPREYQKHALEASRGMEVFAYLMDPGTGKTPTMTHDIHAAAARHEINNATLLLCPNSIKGNWSDELEKHTGSPISICIYDAGKKKHAEQFTTLKTRAHKWFIVGIEQISAKSGREIAEKFMRAHKGCAMAIDESSRIKTWDSKRTEAAIQLGYYAKQRRVATGTMIVKAPHHGWAQFEFLDPRILDLDYMYFQKFFCQIDPNYKRVIGGQNEDILLDMISPYSFVARKADVLSELPEKVHQVRRVEPSREMRDAYHRLLEDAESDDSKYSIALVRKLRLHQLTGGFIVKATAEVRLTELLSMNFADEMLERAAEKILYECEPIPGPNPKIEELKELVQDYDGKVIVWARYVAELEAIAEALRPYGEVVEFHGKVSLEDRNTARRRFQDDPKVRFFVGNQQTGGIGITLTAAGMAVFFSNVWGAEDRIQAEDRIHRIGQVHDSCVYVDLCMSPYWEDKKVYDSVMSGVDYHQTFMNEMRARQMSA